MQRIDNSCPERNFNIPLVPYSTNTGSVVINSEAVLKSESIRFQYLQVDFKVFSQILCYEKLHKSSDVIDFKFPSETNKKNFSEHVVYFLEH